MAVKRKQHEPTPTVWHRPCEPILKEMVFVHIDGDDGAFWDILLTRVPGIGEEIVRKDRYYKVLRVQHEAVGDDGRTRTGWHAFIEAAILPQDEEPPKKRKAKQPKKSTGEDAEGNKPPAHSR